MKSSGLPSSRLDDLAVGHDLGAKAGGAQQRPRRQADERIAAEALAADHRLEQEAVARRVGRMPAQLQVQRERRLEVGERLGDQRNAVVALLRQALEFEFGHRHGRAEGEVSTSGAARGGRGESEVAAGLVAGPAPARSAPGAAGRSASRRRRAAAPRPGSPVGAT